MKMTHTLTLNKQQLSEILVRLMKLPNGTRVVFNLATVSNQRDEWKEFSNVQLSYETELENVPNFEGSSVKNSFHRREG